MAEYIGDKPCAGCNKPGSESPRSKKDLLCYKCYEALRMGKIIQQDYRPEHYQHVSIQFNSLSVYDSYKEDNFGEQFHTQLSNLLKEMHRPGIANNNESLYLGNRERCSSVNTSSFVVRKEYAERIEQLYLILIEQMAAYEKLRTATETELKRIQVEERNNIFNEGVAAGRQLLLQLNTGEISIKEFEAPIPYLVDNKTQAWYDLWRLANQSISDEDNSIPLNEFVEEGEKLFDVRLKKQ